MFLQAYVWGKTILILSIILIICFYLRRFLNKLSFDGVLHLGGRMTSQRYYDFIQKQNPAEYIMVLNHALRNDPNHQVSLRIEASVSNFIQTVIGLLKPRKSSVALKVLSKANKNADKAIESFLAEDERLSVNPALPVWFLN